jgi:hypothetical protein
VVSFTFDDNWESQFLYARPKLDQYGFPATAYVIVGFLDTPDYLTTEQLMDLQTLSGWEVAYHAFDPVMHIESFVNFAPELVAMDMLEGKQWLFENGFNAAPDRDIDGFAYPKGEFLGNGPTDVLAIAREHFSYARTISERHHENLPPSDAHKLRVLYITAPETVEDVIGQLDQALAAGEWVIIGLHHLVEEPTQNDQWQIEKFNALVDYVGTRSPSVPVLTVEEVLSNLETP